MQGIEVKPKNYTVLSTISQELVAMEWRIAGRT